MEPPEVLSRDDPPGGGSYAVGDAAKPQDMVIDADDNILAMHVSEQTMLVSFVAPVDRSPSQKYYLVHMEQMLNLNC